MGVIAKEVLKLMRGRTLNLAATLLILYYPILLYIDLPVYIRNGVVPAGLIFQEMVTAIISGALFYIWILLCERLLKLLFKQFGDEFLTAFNPVAHLITLFAALLLGFAFVLAAREVLTATNNIFIVVFDKPFLMSFPSSHSTEYWELYKRANIAFFLLLMLSAFYLISSRRTQEKMKEVLLRSERLEKQNTLAQLTALRNQVNPHFLFNSLSTLTSLVYEDPALSANFIRELANFYRYSLEQGKEETVELKIEVAFIRSYAYLLTMRFGEKVAINIDIADLVLTQHRIPPHTLQLLVENAVKHNQMSATAPLTIDIYNDAGFIIVDNNIMPRAEAIDSTYLGLQNIIERFRLLSGKQVTVHSSAENFSVRIPLLH
jgi:two-component system, LytTR family, sensor kinase